MTKQEKSDFKELKDLMQDFLKDKRDPGNGWKTERRLFEQQSINSLKTVSEKLEVITVDLAVIPRLCNDIDGIQKWRKTWNKVVIYLGTSIIVPLILFFLYQQLKD